jgi:hypothetical protein
MSEGLNLFNIINDLYLCQTPEQIRRAMQQHGFKWRTDSTSIGDIPACVVHYSRDGFEYTSRKIRFRYMRDTNYVRHTAIAAINNFARTQMD